MDRKLSERHANAETIAVARTWSEARRGEGARRYPLATNPERWHGSCIGKGEAGGDGGGQSARTIQEEQARPRALPNRLLRVTPDQRLTVRRDVVDECSLFCSGVAWGSSWRC